MELKHTFRNRTTVFRILLIVPYGIETASRCFVTRTASPLLIVPYGIETFLDWSKLNCADSFNRTLWN